MGEKIAAITTNALFALISSELTPEELQEFEHYMERTHTIAPILAPTAYRDALYDGSYDKAAARIKLVRAAIEVGKGEKWIE